jgi:hypothetical protein
MIDKIQDLQEDILPFRYNRIKHHFRVLKNTVKVSSTVDKKKLESLREISNGIIKKIKLYERLNSFFYFAIYFSFFSIFFNDIVFLSSITEFVGKIIGVLGTTIFLIASQFVKKIVDLYYQDLDFISIHRITIYSKYQKSVNRKNMIDESDNSYNEFLYYFRKRYKIK